MINLHPIFCFLMQNEWNVRSGIPALRMYLENVLKWPIPFRMVKGHFHKLAGPWLAEHTDLRDLVNQASCEAAFGAVIILVWQSAGEINSGLSAVCTE